MKISIWRQFSSNHSSFFWVIGTFESAESAANARKQILELFHEASPSYGYNAEWEATRLGKLIPDWVEIDTDFDSAITLLGNVLIAHNPDQTWMKRDPFLLLFSQQGATQTVGLDIFLSGEALKEFDMTVELRFTAPHEVTANRLEAELAKYLSGDLTAPDNLPPWHDEDTNFRQAFSKSSYLNAEQVKRLQEEWERQYQSWQRTAPAGKMAREMPSQRLALSRVPTVRRDGLTFRLDQLWFHKELGLAAFLAYLQVQGCTDLYLAYYQIPPRGEGGIFA